MNDLFGIPNALAWGLLAMILHEVGHVLMCDFFSVKIKEIGINWNGLYTIRATSPRMYENVLITSAGILHNLLWFAIGYLTGSYWLAKANLFMAAFYLTPIKGSDGARLLSYAKESYSQVRLSSNPTPRSTTDKYKAS